MRFPVHYVIPWRFGKIMSFFGAGAVHLMETSIVLEGMLPRLNVPLLLTIYHKLFCGHTIRTVPYSVIEKYRPPNLLQRNHLLVFRMPAGWPVKRYAVAFELGGRAANEVLSSRILECMAIAKTFEGR